MSIKALRSIAASSLFALHTLQPLFAGDKVYSPIVEKGEVELESRSWFSSDPDPQKSGAQSHVFELGYGITRFWSSAIVLETEREPGDALKATHVSWENIVQLMPRGKAWLDAGLYLELEKGLHGEPDEVEGRVLVEKSFGKWVATSNAIFTKEISGDDPPGLEFGYNWRVRYRLNQRFEPAIEGYGALGEIRNFEPASQQQHRIGPALLGRFPLGNAHLRYDIAYLRGLTAGTPDSTFQLNLELELRF